jgi:hypothetical protein
MKSIRKGGEEDAITLFMKKAQSKDRTLITNTTLPLNFNIFVNFPMIRLYLHISILILALIFKNFSKKLCIVKLMCI